VQFLRSVSASDTSVTTISGTGWSVALFEANLARTAYYEDLEAGCTYTPAEDELSTPSSPVSLRYQLLSSVVSGHPFIARSTRSLFGSVDHDVLCPNLFVTIVALQFISVKIMDCPSSLVTQVFELLHIIHRSRQVTPFASSVTQQRCFFPARVYRPPTQRSQFRTALRCC
jgi:hypothetical protein